MPLVAPRLTPGVSIAPRRCPPVSPSPATATLSGTPTAAPGSYNFNVKVSDANTCQATKAYALTINCNTITITPASPLPNGTLGTAYSQALTATMSGTGVPAQTWTWALTSGTLPTGLTLNTTTGVISGTPTVATTANITVKATNTQACFATQNYALTTVCPTVSISTAASLPQATQYTSYSTTLSASGGTLPYTWSVITGALPTGLSLNASTGIISGTPTAAPATYNVTVQAADTYGCLTTKAFSIVLICPTITVTPATLPAGTQGTAYSQTLTAAGGTSPYTWSITSGLLPTGLSLNTTTGVISGTPSVVASQTFTVQAKDSNNCFGVISYTVAVGCPVVTIAPASLATATQYAPYSQQLTASSPGVTTTYSFALDTGYTLPAGLTLSTGGLISGNASAAPGNYSVRFKATDTNAPTCVGFSTYTLTIVCPSITLGALSPVTGQTGIAYSATLASSGGTTPYLYSITAGGLPSGVTMTNAGVISGTPNVMPGTFNFTVRSTDSLGCTGTLAYTLTISGRDYGDYSGIPSTSSVINAALKLGANVDPEIAGQANLSASADDAAGLTPDDEDGMAIPFLRQGLGAVLRVAANNASGATAYISAWIDFDNSGTFSAGEQIATDIQVPNSTVNGTFSLPFTVPATADTTPFVGVRVRINSTTGAAAIGDLATTGEVEDEVIQIQPAVVGVGNVVFKDANNNGRYDAGEGVDGVTVQLYTSANALSGTTTTSGGGRYFFNNRTPGSYYVKIPATEFASGKPLVSTFSVVGAGTGSADDSSDENGVDVANVATTGVSTSVFTLAAGTMPTSRPGTELGVDSQSDDSVVFTIENNAGNTGVVGRSYLTLNDYYGGNALLSATGSATFAANGIKGLVYDPQTSLFTAWQTAGNVLTASTLPDLVGATGTYTNTASPFSGAGVTNFGKLRAIANVNGTFYTIETNAGSTGIVGRSYTSLANFYTGTAATTVTGNAAWGATSFRGVGYDSSSSLFFSFYDASSNGNGTVFVASTFSDLITGTGTWASLGSNYFGSGITAHSKTLGLMMFSNYTKGDSNIDLTQDLGFAPCPTITITPASLAAITQYTPMTSVSLSATGGTAPYTYSIISGALPAGLSMTSAGVISGNTTAVAGTYSFTVQATDATSCLGTKAYSLTVNCPTISIAPATLPNGTQYTAYSQALSATTAGTGVPAQTYTWSVSTGTLPTGLTLSSAGLLSGTVTGAPGVYNFTARVQNQDACVATLGYSITIACPTITIAGTLPNGTQDTPYASAALSVSGGTAAYTWSIVGVLPPGLTINATNGAVSGTPTVVGSTTFDVKATDANGCVATKTLTIAVSCPVITISPASISTLTQYAAMTNVVFSAVGGRTPYTWSIDSATPLPAGLTFTPATATLSGTPTAAPGTYSVNVKLLDNSSCPANKTYSIVIGCNTITINNATPLPGGTVGTAYSQTMTATLSGTSVPAQTWTWSLQTGSLPTGLTLSAAGVLSGTPTVATSASFTLKATNAQGCIGTKAMTLTTVCPTIALAPASLPTGYVNGAYTATVSASGGTAAYTYAITSGTLPSGLAFNTTTGAITGTPTATASTTLVIKATDTYGCFGTVSYPLTIKTMGIGNLVFDDCNNNGLFDGGDAGLAGALVQLFNPGADNAIGGTGANLDVQVGSSITTTSTGAYSFTNLPPANYYVKVTPPATHQKTGGTAGTLDNRVDNDNNGTQSALGQPTFSPIINLADGAEPTTDGDTDANTDWTVDFGFWSGVKVGNLVWNDLNNNGLYDSGTESGINGLTVELMSPGADNAVGGTAANADTVVSTMTTAGGGLYGWTIYTPGNYFVRVTANATYALPSGTSVNADNQVDNDNNGVSQPGLAGTVVNSVIFNLSNCETDNTIDIGLRACPVMAITPATLSAATLGTAYTSGTITVSGGTASYAWALTSGTLPTGLTLNTVTSSTASITGTPSGAAGSFNITLQATDALGCKITKAYTIAVSCPPVTLTPATLPIAWRAQPYSQTLLATGATGTVTWSVSPALPTGLTLNTATGVISGSTTAAVGSYPVTVTATDSNNCVSTISYTILVKRMMIGNLVWDDCNNNGIKDASESGLAGAVVTLYASGADNTVNTADDVVVGSSFTTVAGGAYSFTDLAPAKYFVKVVPPAGWRVPGGTPVTLDNQVDGDNNGSQPAGPNTALYSPIVTLADGTESITDGDTDANTELTVDIGLWTGFTVGNMVWNDTSGDGIYQSATESGVSGLTVELMNPGADNAVGGTAANADSVLATTTTAVDGSYGFIVYSAANYYVRVTPNTTYALAALSSVQTDNGIDNDNNGSQPGGQGTAITSMVFNLNACKEPANIGTTNVENTIDFGVRGCPVISITPASLANATQFTSYNTTLTASATGAVQPYTWTLTSGSLPAGLTLASASATTATISGTPTALAGTYNFTVQAKDALNCVGTKAYSITVICPTITISPTTMASATQYSAYSQAFTAVTSGTTVPAQTYTWSATGTLPAGLSLNTSTGTISGTPTGASAPGAYPLTLRVQNQDGCFATQGLTLTLLCPTVTVSGTLTNGTQDTVYTSATMTAAAGTAPYTWTVVGSLPTGLSLNSTTGVVSGTPTVVQSSSFSIKATDANGCVATKAFTVAISCPVITISPASISALTQYATMTPVAFSAVGGRTPYVWSIDSATPLPTGLTFTAGTATLSGTPTAAPGSYNINVKLVDASSCPASMAYTLTINCNTVTITPASLPAGSIGTPYSQTLSAALGGTGVPAQTWTWSLASGTLPAGLSLNATTGVISGTPTGAGSSANITVQATNTQACSGTKAYTIVTACPTIAIAPNALPTGYVNGSYSYTPTASGGVAPYTWAFTTGTLPAGLSLNTSTGAITGTPTSTSSTALVLVATDSVGCKGSISSTLVVKTMGIGNLVWDDCNNNGIKDAGETGLANASVQLFSPGGDATVNTADDVQVGATIVTTSSGAYSFTNLPPSTYFVKVTPPTTHQKTGGTPGTLDNSIDNDNNGAQSIVGQPLYSPIITLADGTESITDGDTDNNTDYTVDFGVWSGVKVGNLVWADTNQNGIKDVTESGIGGLTVRLMSPGADNAIGGTGLNADTVVQTTTSAADGSYSFLLYTAGNYFVSVTPDASNSMPSLLPVSSDNGIDNDNNAVSQPLGAGTPIYSMIFVLSGCEIENTIDFGLSPCPIINVTPLAIGPVTQFTATSTTLTASNGTAPYTWSIQSGALPAGLSLTTTGTNTATVAGTPTAIASTYNVTIRARDALGCVTDVAYPIIVNCPTISITPATIAAATQYAAYSQTFTATTSGTTVPAQTYTWSVTGTIPSGMSFNSTTGILSGTPNSSSIPGNYPITVRVQNQDGCFTTQGYTLVLNCPPIVIAGTLPGGTQDAVYTTSTLSASGGTAPYTWSVIGTLPTGLTLTQISGTAATISGTPTVVQSATFTIKATDSKACIGTQSYNRRHWLPTDRHQPEHSQRAHSIHDDDARELLRSGWSLALHLEHRQRHAAASWSQLQHRQRYFERQTDRGPRLLQHQRQARGQQRLPR